MDESITEFIAETRESLELLDSELVRFEQNPGEPALLAGVFRLIHTIKGTCGFLGLMRLQTVAHAAENVLGEFRAGALEVSPAAVSAILETVDLVRELVEGLARDGAEPAGDDSQLIGRLEDALHRGPIATPAQIAPEGFHDHRPLIQRLGGEATLDAAVESALGRFALDSTLNPTFAGSDPDELQGALRGCLEGLAAGRRGAVSFASALEAISGRAVADVVQTGVFETLARAITELDVADAAIIELRRLCLTGNEASPPLTGLAAGRPESPGDPIPEVAPLAVRAAAAQTAPEIEWAGPGQTIRVSVDALEHLMTVASELVLIRNQLIQVLRLEPESPFAAPLNRLNQVTTELQEGVMTTRMQPISGAWAKFPRLVRDLAQDLGKKIELTLHGQETELDRQVLELIKDPLTHMIRNAADHGLETPQERRVAGKPEVGRIALQARHEGGAIVIEIADDGRGLSTARLRAKAVACGLASLAQVEAMSDVEARQLIFKAGFSTAAEVTAVSGRGVGMDVVRTNIERIGGSIELTSTEGVGTRFTIRIPLTLTIVSALIVECCGERFAMPQSCVMELVSASEGSGRVIEYVAESAVLRLRDRLLPLVSLGALLGLSTAEASTAESCIVVARVGSFNFGVIVDRVFDTEEIVVKPVATILRHLKLYSGATILGDGSVILILDFKGVSQQAGAHHGADSGRDELDAPVVSTSTKTALLIFHAADRTPKAVPLARVARIEEVGNDQIERVEGRTVIQYRGSLMPVIDVDGRPVEPWDSGVSRPLLVFSRDDRTVGLLVDDIVDIVEETTVENASIRDIESGGGLIVAGRATQMIDVERYWSRGPSRGSGASADGAEAGARSSRRLLVIDRSPFTRLLLQPLLAQAGYDVTLAQDAAAALALYDAGEQFQLIMAETAKRGEHAQSFAVAFSKATRWHATPLMGLSLQSDGRGTAQFDQSSLLDAVSSALTDLQEAA